MSEEKFLGVDGCKAGWFFIAIDPGDEAEFGVFKNIDSLFKAYSDAKWILIDIPIGLPSETSPRRICDIEARKRLGPKKASSVFSPPCREALEANTYTEAKQINLSILGRGLNLQTFHISKRIKQVDEFLHRHPESKKRIRESHPELCFRALAGQKPMAHNKKTTGGLEERLEILKQHYPRSSAIYKAALGRYIRKQVGRDDILDALALAVTATHLSNQGITLPEKPDRDSFGLPMEIVYAIPETLQHKISVRSDPEKKMQDDSIITVNNLERIDPDRRPGRIHVNCTYDIIESDGRKYLQIDTHDPEGRKIEGKRSQAIRFSPDAIKQLKSIIEKI